LEACPGARRALLTTADSPFLTAAAIDDYARLCLESRARLCYAAVPRAASEARFPGLRQTYVRLADGEFTGGNAVLIDPAVWPAVRELLAKARAARKQPWLLAQILGPRILWRLVTRRLAIREVEERVSRLLNAPCRGIVTPYAELGADVDDLEDLRVCRELLSPNPRGV
jgi:hypothetical protein